MFWNLKKGAEIVLIGQYGSFIWGDGTSLWGGKVVLFGRYGTVW